MSTIDVSTEAPTKIPQARTMNLSLDVVRAQAEEYERSGGTRGTTLRGVPVVVITPIGARSGKPRKNPVIRVQQNGVYAAVGSKMGAADNLTWVLNLKAHPLVRLQDRTAQAEYIAHEASGASAQCGGTAPWRSGPTTPSTRQRPTDHHW